MVYFLDLKEQQMNMTIKRDDHKVRKQESRFEYKRDKGNNLINERINYNYRFICK